MRKKKEFTDLSNKFRELKSLIYEYKDQRDNETKELNSKNENIRNEIESNQKKYEQLLDEATNQIKDFVKKAKLENLSQ